MGFIITFSYFSLLFRPFHTTCYTVSPEWHLWLRLSRRPSIWLGLRRLLIIESGVNYRYSRETILVISLIIVFMDRAQMYIFKILLNLISRQWPHIEQQVCYCFTNAFICFSVNVLRRGCKTETNCSLLYARVSIYNSVYILLHFKTKLNFTYTLHISLIHIIANGALWGQLYVDNNGKREIKAPLKKKMVFFQFRALICNS